LFLPSYKQLQGGGGRAAWCAPSPRLLLASTHSHACASTHARRVAAAAVPGQGGGVPRPRRRGPAPLSPTRAARRSGRRGCGSLAARGARRAGPERVTRGQAAEKKSAVLDLSKHVDQRVRVKFTGGREGESLCPARDDGAVCASPAQHAEQACVRPPRAGGDATRRGGATGAERCSARAPCTDARRRTLVAASGRRAGGEQGSDRAVWDARTHDEALRFVVVWCG